MKSGETPFLSNSQNIA